jgi:GntR family transcriptional repressor for pyruvate dehydrogenase complex
MFEKLLTLILSGEWKEGDRILPERELSQNLGVGRASLREALKALEFIGMVDSRVGDGTFVCERSTFLSRPLLWAITGNSSTRVDELVESRLVLEGEMAAFAAQRANTEDLKSIEEGLRLLETGLGDANVSLEADLEFHLAIANAAHNQLLLNAVQMIRSLMRQWMLVTLHVPGVDRKVLAQHRAIFNAIQNKSPAEARKAMHVHLEEMGGLLIRLKSAALIK